MAPFICRDHDLIQPRCFHGNLQSLSSHGHAKEEPVCSYLTALEKKAFQWQLSPSPTLSHLKSPLCNCGLSFPPTCSPLLIPSGANTHLRYPQDVDRNASPVEKKNVIFHKSQVTARFVVHFLKKYRKMTKLFILWNISSRHFTNPNGLYVLKQS